MASIHTWAIKWGVPLQAINELMDTLGVGLKDLPYQDGRSEAAVASRVRLEAAQKGLHLWRNNVGACMDDRGNFIRYGLANDSKRLNEVLKSSDLIGIRKVLITPDLVGQYMGQFVARETKPEGWTYSGTDHEVAQLRFLELVALYGGDAAFATGEGTL